MRPRDEEPLIGVVIALVLIIAALYMLAQP